MNVAQHKALSGASVLETPTATGQALIDALKKKNASEISPDDQKQQIKKLLVVQRKRLPGKHLSLLLLAENSRHQWRQMIQQRSSNQGNARLC